MCWAGRDEAREAEQERIYEELEQAYIQELENWRLSSKKVVEHLLPGLREWYEHNHGPDR